MFEIPFVLGTPWSFWLIAAVAGGVGVLTWRGYGRRRGEVKARRLRLLKTLRFIAWAALFFCLLQPIHRTFLKELRASRIAVLVDGSESMSFADRPKGPTRMARVLEWLGDEEAPGFLEKLERSFSARLESFSAGGVKKKWQG